MVLRCTMERTCTLYLALRKELGLSSSLIKNLKWKDALLVNGAPAHTDRLLQPGDEVSAIVEEEAEGYPAEPIPLSILYEDEAIIALDKPSGMLVHPSPCRNEGTLANGLLYYYRQTGQFCAIHPVSRLDRDTFGVVLLAKNAHIHAKFCQMHRDGLIRKTYEAAVFGTPADAAGVISLPIVKVGGGSLMRKVSPEGQSAVTEYRVLQQFSCTAHLQLHPITGRTHQLRLHCRESGFPILGDPQYCSDESLAFSGRFSLSTQQLCAASLEFCHPMTGERICIRSRQKVILPESDPD